MDLLRGDDLEDEGSGSDASSGLPKRSGCSGEGIEGPGYTKTVKVRKLESQSEEFGQCDSGRGPPPPSLDPFTHLFALRRVARKRGHSE